MPQTYKNLYPQICDFDNLLTAYARARKRKKQTPAMYALHFDLEDNLWTLREELLAGVYQPGGYRNFYIYEPKKRKVSAAPFRDRVVHHALPAGFGNPAGAKLSCSKGIGQSPFARVPLQRACQIPVYLSDLASRQERDAAGAKLYRSLSRGGSKFIPSRRW